MVAALSGSGSQLFPYPFWPKVVTMALQWFRDTFPNVEWTTLQSCALRVLPGVGAGLLCEATDFGYLIHDVDSWIGQHAALRPGAVIIEIDDQMLQGLDEDMLEMAFASRYVHGVRVLTLDAVEIDYHLMFG